MYGPRRTVCWLLQPVPSLKTPPDSLAFWVRWQGISSPSPNPKLVQRPDLRVGIIYNNHAVEEEADGPWQHDGSLGPWRGLGSLQPCTLRRRLYQTASECITCETWYENCAFQQQSD